MWRRSIISGGGTFTRLVAVLVCSSLGAASAQAQSVRGRVLDEESGKPIPEVELTLMRQMGVIVGQPVRSDDSGSFVVRVPSPGQYTLRARRIGYAAVFSAPFVVPAGEDVTLQLIITPRISELQPVTVTSAPGIPAHLEAFEHRRLIGIGSFLTRDDIERRGAPPLIDLLRGIPGVRVIGSGPQSHVEITRSLRGVACHPIVYADGVRMNRTGESSVIMRGIYAMFLGGSIDGIEVYRGRSELPAEFGGLDARCGVIVVWSRRSRAKDESPPPL